MAVHATTAQSVTLDVGDQWVIGVYCTDEDGDATAATVAVAVTTPAGGSATPTAEAEDATGYYTARYVVAAAGRYLAVVTVSGDAVGVAPFTAWAESATAASGMPALADVQAYLGEDTSATTAQITAALAAEAAAQRKVCEVPAVYPPDLAEALLRRVARNLAARAVPIAQWTSFEGGATGTRVPQSDPEVTRLEAPYRRWVVA